MSSSESAHQEATNTGDSVSTNAGSRDGDSPGNHGNQPDKDKDNANNDERSTIHDRKGSPTECIEIPVENSGGSGGSQTLLRRRRSSENHKVGHDLLNDEKPEESWREVLLTVSNISNSIAFVVMIIGIIGVNETDDAWAKYILSGGLFSFAGGMTNWLAVKMLFDRIPGLIGSGVIPNRFREIRQSIKATIMVSFFDENYLETYLNDRTKELLSKYSDTIKQKVDKLLASEEVDEIIASRLREMAGRTDQTGQLLNMAMFTVGGGTVEGLAPHLKPIITSFGHEAITMLIQKFDARDFIDAKAVRSEIDSLMTEKLKQLTPLRVKTIMERVIRKHLGWLIVWGNVFGGIIGLISQAAGFGA